MMFCHTHSLFSKMFYPKVFCFGLCLFFYFLQVCSASDILSSSQDQIQQIFKDKETAVVRVKATRVDKLNSKAKRFLKMGSGFFISKDGHVLTTGLLSKAERIWVEHRGTYLLAEEIGNDPMCNISLLKVMEPPADISFIKINDSFDQLAPGSFLVGITCALEFRVSPTFGIAQSEEFSFGKRLFPTKMLRSSLALGPGEVGAPIFNLSGNFIGIAHAALPDLSSSFILPAKACKRIRDDLLLSGKVEYGWFGITTTRKLNDSNSFDIVISGFIEDSPAKNSNLKIGDILLSVGQQKIMSQGDLANASFFSEPETNVEFRILRQDKELVVPVRVSARSFPNKEDSLSKFNIVESNASALSSTGNLKIDGILDSNLTDNTDRLELK